MKINQHFPHPCHPWKNYMLISVLINWMWTGGFLGKNASFQRMIQVFACKIPYPHTKVGCMQAAYQYQLWKDIVPRLYLIFAWKRIRGALAKGELALLTVLNTIFQFPSSALFWYICVCIYISPLVLNGKESNSFSSPATKTPELLSLQGRAFSSLNLLTKQLDRILHRNYTRLELISHRLYEEKSSLIAVFSVCASFSLIRYCMQYVCWIILVILFPALDAGSELDQDGQPATLELHAAYELLKCNFFNGCASVNPSQRSSLWSLKYVGCVKWPSILWWFW